MAVGAHVRGEEDKGNSTYRLLQAGRGSRGVVGGDELHSLTVLDAGSGKQNIGCSENDVRHNMVSRIG